MDPETARPRAPRALVALIVIWVAVQLYIYFASHGPTMWPDYEPRGIAVIVGDVLQFLYAFLIVALFAYGLLKAHRFMWAATLAWHGIQAGFALVSLSLMNYQLDDFPTFTGFPLYGIALPLALAALSFVILLLPATRSWIRGSQSFGSSRSVV